MTDTDSPKKNAKLLAALLAIAIVTGVFAVWNTAQVDSPDANAETSADAAQPIEVEPLIPRGRIAGASWHQTTTRTDEELDEGPDPDNQEDWFDVDQDERAEREESLRKVLKRAGGLAVSVVENDDGSR